MQIAYHIGAHSIDEDQLLKSTLRNVDMLAKKGIAVPGPGKYRSLIRSTIQGLDGAHPAPGTRDVLLDSIVESDDVQRLLLSNANFICIANRIFEHGVFYPQAETKTRAMRKLFPDDELSFYLSICHPATFIQDALRRPKSTPLGDFLGIMHPEEVRWADVVRRIHTGTPDAELVVWCNEDAPIVWPKLIRRFMGLPQAAQVLGGLTPLIGLMEREGIDQLREQLNANPQASELERQTLIADYWEDYAIPETDEEEIDLPDLDEYAIAQITENYEADLAEIAAMDGVTLVLPFS